MDLTDAKAHVVEENKDEEMHDEPVDLDDIMNQPYDPVEPADDNYFS